MLTQTATEYPVAVAFLQVDFLLSSHYANLFAIPIGEQDMVVIDL